MISMASHSHKNHSVQKIVIPVIVDLTNMMQRTTKEKVDVTAIAKCLVEATNSLNKAIYILNTGTSTTITTLHIVQNLVVNLRNVLTTGNTKFLFSILQQILNHLKSLQTDHSSTTISKEITTIVNSFTTIDKQVHSGKFDVSSIQKLIDDVVKNLDHTTTTITEKTTGSATTQITTIHKTITTFQNVITTGDVSRIKNMIPDILNQINQLEAKVSNVNARNEIIMLVSHIYSLQQHLVKQKPDLSMFISFVTSLRKGLDKIEHIIKTGSTSTTTTTTTTKITKTDITNVQSVFSKLETIVKGGSTKGIDTVLHQLLTQLYTLSGRVPNHHAKRQIVHLITNVTKLTQLTTGSKTVDMKMLTTFLTHALKQLHHFTTTVNDSNETTTSSITTTTTTIHNVQTLLKDFTTVVNTKNVQNITKMLHQILTTLHKLKSHTSTTVRKEIKTIVHHFVTVQRQVKSGKFDITNIQNLISSVFSDLDDISTQITTSETDSSDTNKQITDISVLIENFRNVVSTNNHASIISNLMRMLIDLTKLQSIVKDVKARTEILTIIGNIYSLQQQTQMGTSTTDDFNFFITNVTTGLKHIQAIVNGGKDTTQSKITVLQVLVERFKNAVAKGDNKLILAVLKKILVELTTLQSKVNSLTARNVILSIIGNIYTLEIHARGGKATKADFAFFITNIQNGLKQIQKIIGGESSTTNSVSTEITNVTTLIKTLHTVLTTGNVKNITTSLQQILAILKALGTQTKNTTVTKIISTVTNTLTKVEKTVHTGKFDISSIWDQISSINDNMKQISTITTSNSKITNIFTLLHRFEKTVTTSNVEKIVDVLNQVRPDERKHIHSPKYLNWPFVFFIYFFI